MNTKKLALGLLVLLVVLSLGIGACGNPTGSGGNKGGNGPADELGGEEHVDYAVRDSDVLEGECLSVQKLVEKLRSFPADTRMRRVTTDFTIHSGNTRRNFELLLTFGTYRFEESKLSRFTVEFDNVVQTGCEKVTFRLPGGVEDVFNIKEFSANSLEIENTEDRRSYTFRLTGEQSLEVRTGYTAVDYQCSREAEANVSYVEVIRWGGEDVGQIPAETIDTDYLRTITQATNEDVESLASLLDAADSDVVLVPAVELRKLTRLQADPGYRACWGFDSGSSD